MMRRVPALRKLSARGQLRTALPIRHPDRKSSHHFGALAISLKLIHFPSWPWPCATAMTSPTPMPEFIDRSLSQTPRMTKIMLRVAERLFRILIRFPGNVRIDAKFNPRSTEEDIMKKFGYVLAALGAIVIAAPSIASAETVVIKPAGYHHVYGPP